MDHPGDRDGSSQHPAAEHVPYLAADRAVAHVGDQRVDARCPGRPAIARDRVQVRPATASGSPAAAAARAGQGGPATSRPLRAASATAAPIPRAAPVMTAGLLSHSTLRRAAYPASRPGPRRAARAASSPPPPRRPRGRPGRRCGLTARTPRARSTGMISAIGRVSPAAAAAINTYRRGERQHERRLHPSGVRVRIYKPRVPHVTLAPFIPELSYRGGDRGHVAAMPVDQQHHRPVQARVAAELDKQGGQGRGADRQGAGEVRVLAARPDRDRRRERHALP